MRYNPKTQTPKIERVADPEIKEEYEMPLEYQKKAELLVEVIDQRDNLAKMMLTMSPEERRAAQPMFDEANTIVEDLEEKMALEYESYQEEARLEQELTELTEWQDVMSEEHFIYVKHKKPYLFARFEEIVTADMTEEERSEHYDAIARREAEELDGILSGKITAQKYHNPFIHIILPKYQLPDIQLDIISHTYETNDYFREKHAAIKQLEDIRFKAVMQLPRVLPAVRKNAEQKIREIREKTHLGRLALLDYFAKNRESFVPIENPDRAEIDELYKRRREAEERLFIVAKHIEPEIFEQVKEMLLSDYETPEEVEAFFGRVAESESKWLKALLSAAADE